MPQPTYHPAPSVSVEPRLGRRPDLRPSIDSGNGGSDKPPVHSRVWWLMCAPAHPFRASSSCGMSRSAEHPLLRTLVQRDAGSRDAHFAGGLSSIVGGFEAERQRLGRPRRDLLRCRPFPRGSCDGGLRRLRRTLPCRGSCLGALVRDAHTTSVLPDLRHCVPPVLPMACVVLLSTCSGGSPVPSPVCPQVDRTRAHPFWYNVIASGTGERTNGNI